MTAIYCWVIQMLQRTRSQGQRYEKDTLRSDIVTLPWPPYQIYSHSSLAVQVIEVSDDAIVLPLAHQQSLVGLLFVEGGHSPVMPALTGLTAEALSTSTALSR